MVQCDWDEVPHLSDAQKKALRDSYPPFQRDARTRGIPQLGAGAIYPVPESEIIVPPFDIPSFWPRGYGLDVGWNRTAAIWGAVDRETTPSTIYLYSEHYKGEAEPSVHAAGIRNRGAWMRGTIDPAARGRGQRDGEQLLQNYLDLGLHLIPAENARESGIFLVWEALSQGRLKVFTTLVNWLAEYRLYRRDEKGNVVKENDHLMDATRYLAIMLEAVVSVNPTYLQRLGHVGGIKSDYDPIHGAA